MVALRRRIEVAGIGARCRRANVFMQSDAAAGFIRNLDDPLVDGGFFHAFHQVLPPREIARMVFAGQQVFGRGRAVDAG